MLANDTKSNSNIIPEFDQEYFEFGGVKYKIQDILKLSKLIPVKKCSLSVLNPILRTIPVPTTETVHALSQHIVHILNFNINYLLLLEITELEYKYIYGYEYVVKSLNNKIYNLAVKIIKPNLLQQLYLKKSAVRQF